MERDVRIVLDVEEVFALQLAVLHAASGIDAGSLSLDIQNTRRDIRRGELHRGIPLVKFTGYSDRGFDIESDRAFCLVKLENRNSCGSLRPRGSSSEDEQNSKADRPTGFFHSFLHKGSVSVSEILRGACIQATIATASAPADPCVGLKSAVFLQHIVPDKPSPLTANQHIRQNVPGPEPALTHPCRGYVDAKVDPPRWIFIQNRCDGHGVCLSCLVRCFTVSPWLSHHAQLALLQQAAYRQSQR